MSTYVTKCVATQTRAKALSGMTRFTHSSNTAASLHDACGGTGPPPCADGDAQVGELYAEAAGAYYARNEGQVIVNVVRTCYILEK